MTDNADVMGTPPSDTTDATPTTQSAPEFNVPAEYQEKGWAKNIKSEADLWKTLDNAQGLIGRKTIGIPDFDNAKDEEIAEYYTHTRPSNASDYELDPAFSEEEKAGLQKVFFENGLNKRQAKNLMDHIQSEIVKDYEADFGEDGLKAELERRFGQNWEQVIVPIKNALNSVLTKEQSESLNDNLSNEAVGALFSLTQAIMQKYGANETDTALGRDRAAVAPKMSYEEFFNKMKAADAKPDGYLEKKQLIKQFYGE